MARIIRPNEQPFHTKNDNDTLKDETTIHHAAIRP